MALCTQRREEITVIECSVSTLAYESRLMNAFYWMNRYMCPFAKWKSESFKPTVATSAHNTL